MRKNYFINKIVRVCIKRSHIFFIQLYALIINRWTSSGNINCNFNGVHFRMFNQCDDHLVDYFYYNKPYHEENDLKLFVNLSKSSSCIVDIGANSGLYSILGSYANPKAKIYSIEPYSINVKRLKKNIELNKCGNIYVEQIGIGDRKGSIMLNVPENNSFTDVSSMDIEFSKKVYPNTKWKTENINIDTLDNFRTTHQLKVDLIKCDVEGFEMKVFEGMNNLLNADRPVVIFECFLDEERKTFFNAVLKKYNYFVYLILAEGLIYLDNGFEDNVDGLNYLITPVLPLKNFLSYSEIENDSQKILNNKI